MRTLSYEMYSGTTVKPDSPLGASFHNRVGYSKLPALQAKYGSKRWYSRYTTFTDTNLECLISHSYLSQRHGLRR